MKLVYIAVIVGFILLYFVLAALKIDLFNWEMLIHSAIRFFSGFIILGVGCLYAQKLQLKVSLSLVLAFIVADDILDYYRDTTRFSVESILYGAFMLSWGSITGYLAMKGKGANS